MSPFCHLSTYRIHQVSPTKKHPVTNRLINRATVSPTRSSRSFNKQIHQATYPYLPIVTSYFLLNTLFPTPPPKKKKKKLSTNTPKNHFPHFHCLVLTSLFSNPLCLGEKMDRRSQLTDVWKGFGNHEVKVPTFRCLISIFTAANSTTG